MVTSYKDITVERDKVDPRQMNVFLRFVPAYPINYVYIDIDRNTTRLKGILKWQQNIHKQEVYDSYTKTGLSTQIVIMVNGNPVGAIQSFGEQQNRSIKPINEVGTDGQMKPQSSTTIKLNIQRVVFDGLSVTEAFSRGFRNIAAKRIPFDIIVLTGRQVVMRHPG